MVGEMKKIKYGVIQKLYALSNKLNKTPLPMQTSYWLKRNLENVSNSCKKLDVERIGLVKRYGTQEKYHIQKLIDALPKKDDIETKKLLNQYETRLNEINKTGSDFYLFPENNEDFNKLWDDLMEKEIDVIINPIEITAFADAKFTASDLTSIDFMLCEKKLIKTSNIIQ